MSSGYKINRAADDAAGLAISEKMRRQIRGLNKGIENAEDGISYCQIADGALEEVDDMLHRINELTIKAANGTNSLSDRNAIQDEIDQLVVEIDRIGETTKFNERKVFSGDVRLKEVMLDPDGGPGNIPFSDFKLNNINLGENVFSAGQKGNMLCLRAVVDNPDSAYNHESFKLIFGDGSTSDPTLRVRYTADTMGAGGVTVPSDKVEIIKFSNMDVVSVTVPSGVIGQRILRYVNDDGINIDVIQTISINQDSDTEKSYKITHTIRNNSIVSVNSTSTPANLDFDFMFHADTAYNNNDRCEGYFIDGNRMDKFSAYYAPNSSVMNPMNNHPNCYQNVPDSFSIIDVENALAFSEKIDVSGDKPDAVSLGRYSAIRDWSYYNSPSGLGENAIEKDLGFSLIWERSLQNGNSVDISFNYGIVATEKDDNIKDIAIKKDLGRIESSYISITDPLWIQYGNEVGHGMNIGADALDVRVLGLEGIIVKSEKEATKWIGQMDNALRYVNGMRSKIGAYQNRLEHVIKNEKNIVENTTYAESRIRDTDMAKESLTYHNANILVQAGQSVLAQANQSNQGILALIA